MSAHRCGICNERTPGVGWCGGCRQSYRAQRIARANVMEVAQWGADRARAAVRRGQRFERQLEQLASAIRQGGAS